LGPTSPKMRDDTPFTYRHIAWGRREHFTYDKRDYQA
jgi:hypothetical protein